MRFFSQLFKSKPPEPPEHPGELPIIPGNRWPLSRQPSQEHLPGSTSQSLLLHKLPPELRRRILEIAFGNQTIHIDLIHEHPPQKLSPKDHIGHGGYPLTAADNGSNASIKLNKSIKKDWQWRSSVCHRNGPQPGPPGHQVNAAQDVCRHGLTHSQVCHLWPGTAPQKCQIGAMGWLRTCRQAYVEGVDVLYATNTFHIASQDLMMNIHDLIPSQRLKRISSVELVWEIPKAPPWHINGNSEIFKYLRPFWYFVDAMPAMFPNVRKVHLAVQWHPSYLAHIESTYSEIFFGCTQSGIIERVDGLVRKLPTDVDFSLAIPSSMYRPRRDIARKNSKIEQASVDGKMERFWWDMYGVRGYWIHLGLRDIIMPSQLSVPSGTGDPRLLVENYILYSQTSESR